MRSGSGALLTRGTNLSIHIQFNVVLTPRVCRVPSLHAWFWHSSVILIYLYFTDEAYKFPLDVACKKKSEKELNEKDEERIGSVRALRKWALERQDWLKTPVGRYIRGRSGSAVEYLSRDRRVAGSSLTGGTAFCP